ncbi:MAG: VTT domain-containing protein [Actinomycetota bacterium]|nr:VTT domain-containing protein [Actinomycetota bacterium]
MAHPWRAIGLTLVAILALVGCLLAIEPLREAFADVIRGDTGGLREDLRGLGATGIAILFLLVAIHTFVWYPAEIVDAAAGFVFGFWPAMIMLTIGWTAQALAAYAIGRRAARPLLHRFVGQPRFDRLERAVESGGVTLLLAARLVPIVPFSLFSYVAGAAHVPIWRFTWTTAIGYIPITAVSIYLGSRLEDLSPTDPLIWAAALVVIALLLLTRRLRPLLEAED